MGIIDFILNFAALLTWLHWRSLRYNPLARASAATLAGTLRPAEPARLPRPWHVLCAIPAILLLRFLFCLYLGAPAGWNPKINLYFVVLAFRGDLWDSALLFSVLDFLKLLVVVYFWAIFLTVLDRSVADADPVLRLLRLQLGRLSRWSGWVTIVALLCLTMVLWVVCQPLLVQVGVLGKSASYGAVVIQGALVALGLVLTLKFVLPVFLLLHFMSSYVYLGNGAVWDFISATARNLLKPLKKWPLQAGKLDLAPLAGVILILLFLEIVPRLTLAQLKGRTIWPE